MKRNSFVLLVFCVTGCVLQNFATAQGVRGTPIGSPIASQPVVAPSADGTNSPASETKDGYLQTGFDKLSGFLARVVYEAANSNSPAFEPRLASPVPENIKALDSKKVSVSGFMLPLKLQEGRVTEFILLKNQMMCCYGRPPVINEWIHVKILNGIKPAMDQTITIYGTLHVSEYKENAQMLGLYRLDGEKMEASSGS
jgi:hypothetical protein